MQKTLRKKFAAGVVVAGVLAGGGTAAAVLAGSAPAMAEGTTIAAAATTPAPSCVPVPLQGLVGNGTITQAQATAVHDALFAYVQANRPVPGTNATASPMLAPNGALQTVLGQLVSNGTITEAQASAITDAMSSHANARVGAGFGMHAGNGLPRMGMSGFGPPWASGS